MQAGIAAVQRGEREHGRRLLLHVIEQDEHNEQAWLWLSQAVDDPADAQVALENVLTLNPDNREAQTRLEQLRTQAAAPADPWQSLLPTTPHEPDDGIDDPLQCVYCGGATQEAQRRCPHCGRNLYVRVRQSHDSGFLRLGLLLFGILAALAFVQIALPLLALNALRDGSQGELKLLLVVPGAQWVLGDLLSWTRPTATLLAYGLGARAIVLAALLVGLRQRWTLTYYAALAALAVDVLLNAVLLFGGFLSIAGGILNMGLALAILYLIGASYQEFTVTQERLLTRPDSQAHSAAAFHKLGHDYSRAEMWALAVAQWRRAVGLAPREVAYYKHLGIGYARIQRYARSLRVLEEAARRAPNDRDLHKIIALVREQAGRNPGHPK